MIYKHFQLNNLNFKKNNIYLFYGKNEGFQNEIIDNYFIKDFTGEINRYDENEFINNSETIISGIFTNSLFVNEKLIIISRTTDKIIKFIEDILEKQLIDIKIVLKCGVLDKKSKLRSLFEKNKSLITIPFYEDEIKDLMPIVVNYLKENKIKISRESINLILSRASGSRDNLKIELEKILNYSFSNKNIDLEVVQKITNLSENYSVSELADNFLLKNTKNIVRILNENNYSNEDCILIIRTILNKSKRLLNLIEKFKKVKNIEEVISNTKPPIFWKDKENVKKQINTWDLDDLKNKIYRINELETLIKNNSINSLHVVSDFIVRF